MDVLFDICCGLDVHSTFVVACVMRGALSGRPEKLVRTFVATTRGLCECKYSVNPAPGCDLGLDTFSGLW